MTFVGEMHTYASVGQSGRSEHPLLSCRALNATGMCPKFAVFSGGRCTRRLAMARDLKRKQGG